ncbi:MAG: NTP transferase domain-containing protein [Candidatus Berkelbacteria bacterium]|nr:NTP transferase domain-containing protein [Candidatus Berkelbacteria bacterium]
MNLDIGILAGGDGKRLKAKKPKAWVKVGDITLCERVVREVQGLKPNKTFVICHHEYSDTLSGYPNIEILKRTGSFLGDLFSIVSRSKADMLVIVDADAVLISTDNLFSIIELADREKAGFLWPVVPKHLCYPQHGGYRYVLGNKDLVRGNLFIFRPKQIHVDQKLLDRMIKYPAISELFALGFWNCLKYVFGTITVSDGLNCIGKALGCSVQILVMHNLTYAFDIDFQEDLQTAEGLLRQQGRL